MTKAKNFSEEWKLNNLKKNNIRKLNTKNKTQWLWVRFFFKAPQVRCETLIYTTTGGDGQNELFINCTSAGGHLAADTSTR